MGFVVSSSSAMLLLVSVLVLKLSAERADTFGLSQLHIPHIPTQSVSGLFWKTVEQIALPLPSTNETSTDFPRLLDRLSSLSSEASSSFLSLVPRVLSIFAPFAARVLVLRGIPALAFFAVHAFIVRVIPLALSALIFPIVPVAPIFPVVSTFFTLKSIFSFISILVSFAKLSKPTAQIALVLHNTHFHEREMGPYRVECTPAEADCLRNGQLPYEGACYAPLTRAACPGGQWLVLNESAAEGGRLRAVCAPRRPCGSGKQMMHANGRCYSEEDIRRWLCPGDDLLYLPSGDAFCSATSVRVGVVGEAGRGVCNVTVVTDG